MQVWCPSCHRRESRGPDGITVELAGGSRRPSEHPTLAAWRTLRKARQGGRIVVGACVCGQPMLADPPAPGVPWTLETPDGPVQVGSDLVGPDGPLDEDAAEALLEGHFRERLALRPGVAAFRTGLIVMMLAPVLLWAAAVLGVIGFLIGFGTRPGFQ